MAWVERLVTRTTQPQDAAGLSDWARGAGFKTVTIPGPDIIGNSNASYRVSVGSALAVATPKGKVTKYENGTHIFYDGGCDDPRTGYVVAFYGCFSAVGTWSGLFARNADTGTTNGLAWQREGSLNVLRIAHGGTNYATGSINDLLDSTPRMWVLGWKNGVASLYRDGVLYRTVSVAASPAFTPGNGRIRPASSRDTSLSSAELSYFAFATGVGPTLELAKNLFENPWQIFEPEVQRIWIDDTVTTGGAATVIPIGVQATGSVGTPSATGAATTTPAGVSASSAVGTPVAVGGTSIAATVLPAGVQATAAIGTVSARGAAVAQPAGVTATGAVGTPVAIAGTSIPATVLPAGVQASSAVGTPTAKGAAIAQPLGVAATAYVGAPTIATGVSGVVVAYPAGVQAIGQVGTLIATGAAWTAAVGVQAVASVGTPFAYEGALISTTAGAQTRPSRLQSSSRPSRMQTGTRASR